MFNQTDLLFFLSDSTKILIYVYGSLAQLDRATALKLIILNQLSNRSDYRETDNRENPLNDES